MSAKTEILGALSIKYTGESPPEGENGRKVKSGRHIGPTVVGSFGNVLLERRVDDVKYTFRATETTIQNLKALNGSVLTVEKPFGPVTATVGLELGPVRALTTNLKSKWNYSRQRFLELGAFWNERTKATVLSFTAQPHAKAKLTSVFRSGTLKGSYAHEAQTAGLEYDFKPFKVAVTSKLNGKEAGKPNLLLTFKSDTFVRDVKSKASGKAGSRDSTRRVGGVPEVARDIPLDRKLRELDELYAPKLAQAESNRAKNDNALFSKSK